MNANKSPLWKPSADQINSSLLTSFMSYLRRSVDNGVTEYDQLYSWSVNNSTLFWSAVWQFTGVIGEPGEPVLVDGDDIEKARWFPAGSLNFAENLLRKSGDEVAIYSKAEDKRSGELSWNELRSQVASLAEWMRAMGVGEGDRVAGYLPNIAESVVAMLATASLGAIWTSTSPDFGQQSVVERFGQTEPKILITTDGYYYNGKTLDIRAKVRGIAEQLSTVEQLITISMVGLDGESPGLAWQEVLQQYPDAELRFTRVNFNAPLYILYSSGTTGKPKCIAHKVGGVLLQHLKELQLHSDVKPGDRVFYFTTCGWMMWNWLVSSLACDAALVLYDGSPFYPDGNVLWDYAQQTGTTLFGTSAKYIDALKKQNITPKDSHDLSRLRTLCSTGSVLVPESFDYIYKSIKEDLCVASISGGTDIVSCFVLGCPIIPVYRGECQTRGLGMAVEVFDEKGRSVIGTQGELVCTATFPSQPACFWGDDSGEKYHNAYFAEYANVWHHGDYVQLSENGGVTIFGRSDATLNPGGVRIGTAEIYRYVEAQPEVLESIAIGQDYDNDIRVLLFVVLRKGRILDDELRDRIRKTVRDNCSPRHVPAKILQIDEVPRTKSGKIVELAVKEVVHNRPVKNKSALANPEALRQFADLEELQ
jgi:acetoacetyl-CoA synthetase